MTRLYYFLCWLFIFGKALVKANIDVAKKALAPSIDFHPGFLSVPMQASTDFEITSLANSITLTPGTISVHVAADRRSIVIHAIDIGGDPDVVRKDVQDTLEANILRWTRPERRRQ